MRISILVQTLLTGIYVLSMLVLYNSGITAIGDVVGNLINWLEMVQNIFIQVSHNITYSSPTPI